MPQECNAPAATLPIRTMILRQLHQSNPATTIDYFHTYLVYSARSPVLESNGREVLYCYAVCIIKARTTCRPGGSFLDGSK